MFAIKVVTMSIFSCCQSKEAKLEESQQKIVEKIQEEGQIKQEVQSSVLIHMNELKHYFPIDRITYV